MACCRCDAFSSSARRASPSCRLNATFVTFCVITISGPADEQQMALASKVGVVGDPHGLGNPPEAD